MPIACSSLVAASRQPDSTKIAFKSKVVSRAHAEIWCAPSGKFMIRDTRSSSGTFLNHTRLSAPNIESRPTELHDGDIVQLGVDYQGGAEEIYRCVKIRVEVGREWQREANEFNTGALKQLQTLQGRGTDSGKEKAKDKPRTSTPSVIAGPSNSRKTSVADCCICKYHSSPRIRLANLIPEREALGELSVPGGHPAELVHCPVLPLLPLQVHSAFAHKAPPRLLLPTLQNICRPRRRRRARIRPECPRPSVYAPSVRAPSIYAASVHEAEAVVGLIEAAVAANAPRNVSMCFGIHDQAIDAGYWQRSTSARKYPLGPATQLGWRIHPRGSSEDLRAAQRGLFDSTLVSDEPEDELVRVPGGIIVPRSPIVNTTFSILSHSDRAQRRRIGPSFYPFRGGHPCPPPHLGIRIQRRLGHTLPSQDTESAKHILVDDEEDDNDKEDDDALVIDSMKRMSVATETEAGPSSQVKKI
ncbi:Forkhead associated domain [Rhizoctonia solani]|uniref:Forkhead associated domain n=1 Tax=Rhizoctonia solani TaxID=456999 RepID=A0A8H7I5K5_9AGAM|nr:Forkhead associated domain [Rhizoctonia solani]